MVATVLQLPVGPRPPPFDVRGLKRGLVCLLEVLAQAVDERRRDEGFRELLGMMARLWRYSFFNQWLIETQRPEARKVAGRRAWERMGRRIQPGARPIAIVAPSHRAGGGLRTVWVRVFDVRDTEGPPLAEWEDVPQTATAHVATLERAAARCGVEVLEQVLPRGVAGWSLGGRIVLRPGIMGVARCRALAHELAHELLHQEERARRATLRRPGPARTRAEEETEADATAHVVLTALGLPSGVVDYIAWQGGTGLTVLRSMRRIQGAAQAILAAAAGPEQVGKANRARGDSRPGGK